MLLLLLVMFMLVIPSAVQYEFIWILLNFMSWTFVEPTTEATFRSSSVRLKDCVLLPWQGGTRIRWSDEDASWGSRFRHLFHCEKLFHVPKSTCQRSNKAVVSNTFRVSKILGRNVEDTSLQQNGRRGRLELLQCPHDFEGGQRKVVVTLFL